MTDKNYNAIEDFMTDESFLNFYFNKNEEDVLDWKDWLEDNPHQKMTINEAFQLLNMLSLKWSEQQIKDKYLVLKGQIDSENKIQDAPIIHLNNYRWWAAAAAVLIVFSCSLYLYLNTKTTNVSPAISIKTLDNPLPNHAKVYYLSDGSIIRLNSKSQLQIADDYGQRTRDVFLIGEAFFEVAKDALHPFNVRAGGTVTTAVGTAFNVRAFANEKEVKVSLVEGKVIVKQKNTEGDKTESVELNQGQQVRLLTQTSTLTPIETFKPQITTAWKEDGYIQLEKTSLHDVLDMLQGFYTVRFEVKDKALLQQSLSGTISRKMALSETLEVLAFANNFQYKMANHSTVLIFK